MKLIRNSFFLLVFMGCSFAALAQKTQAELEKERNAIQREIAAIQNALSETTKNRKSSLTQLSLLQRRLKLRENAISNMNQEIWNINNDMYLSALEIKKLKGELDTLKFQYAESLVYAYKNRSNYDFLNFIFSASDFNDAIKRVSYLKSYRNYRDKQTENITKTQALLQDKIDGLRQTRKQKDDALASANKEREVLAEEKQEQDQVVVKLRSKEKELQSEISTRRQQDKKLQSAITAIIRREAELARLEERKRQEAANKAYAEKLAAEKAAAAKNTNTASKEASSGSTAASSAKNTPAVASSNVNISGATESTASKRTRSDFELTPEGVISSTAFEKNKGSLPWPVETGVVVYDFGSQTYQGTGLVFKNDGYTIHTPIGTPVKAVFSGEVTSVYYLDANTNSQMIMLKHGKYFSVYGGVTNPTVTKGQEVKAGQVLGRVVTSEEGVGELDFRLLIESRYLNPAQWLKRK